jgi:hypothetical protein
VHERIPIASGFYIEFSADGRALNHGLEESRALPAVLSWLATHQGSSNRELVERWVQQKEQQIEDEAREKRIEGQRETLNAFVDRTARESKIRDRDWIELVRAAIFEKRGISQDDV